MWGGGIGHCSARGEGRECDSGSGRMKEKMESGWRGRWSEDGDDEVNRRGCVMVECALDGSSARSFSPSPHPLHGAARAREGGGDVVKIVPGISSGACGGKWTGTPWGADAAQNAARSGCLRWERRPCLGSWGLGDVGVVDGRCRERDVGKGVSASLRRGADSSAIATAQR